MSTIAYYRVSTTDQSIESQRAALGGNFDKEFSDVGVSGVTSAKDREGFSALLDYIREGDVLHVYSIDRLGRNAIDIQTTIRFLINKGVILHIYGLGSIGSGVGEIITAVLAQVADMERKRISDRCAAGRLAAKQALTATGRTHRGKESLGRPKAADPNEVKKWRMDNNSSIRQTAIHFGISSATVSRYCGSDI